MAMLCLFILLGFTTNSLSATAVKNNMSSTSKATKAPSAKATKAPTAKSTKTKPITVTECGLSFTDQKVVLTDNLDCGSRIGDQQDCAVTLDGPEAEIDCNDFTLSQVASVAVFYADGPFFSGICLNNGATAINCNVKKFVDGIYVINGGEVVNSNLSPNQFGIYAKFRRDSTLTIEDTDANSNSYYYGLYIDIDSGVEAKLDVKGEVTLNSNGLVGMYLFLEANTKLDIAVLNDATLESCGNIVYDISGVVPASATATFSGTGYTCDQAKVVFNGDGGGTVGTVVPPNCQACPVP
eukprot:scaffold11173_cov99-Skeletonema_menzelii.AAC.3